LLLVGAVTVLRDVKVTAHNINCGNTGDIYNVLPVVAKAPNSDTTIHSFVSSVILSIAVHGTISAILEIAGDNDGAKEYS
jgi:hypothetical protein